MQAFSLIQQPGPYAWDMQAGRPSKHPRTAFGERLHAARSAAGLSQAQVAEQLGITQTSYADWERHPVALRPDQIEQLTRILKVSVEQLYGGDAAAKARRGGPMGKARTLFEEVSRLPRSQQQHVLRVVGDLLAAQRVGSKAG